MQVKKDVLWSIRFSHSGWDCKRYIYDSILAIISLWLLFIISHITNLNLKLFHFSKNVETEI